DTKLLQPTNHVEHNSLRFLGNLRLNLWDCGGQDQFMENYFESQRENIFQHCEVLIYVLVAVRDQHTQVDERKKDIEYFKAAC
ncbi:Rraga, partial [Symbiodinium pilosum]